MQRSIPWAAGLILAVFAIRGFVQTFVWHDNLALFTNGLAVNPNSSAACDGIAAEIAPRGRLDEAKRYAHQAVEIDPARPEAYVTLGSIENMLGDLPGALETFHRGVNVAPESADILSYYGAALAQSGNLPEAETYLRKAISLNPARLPKRI